MQQYILAALPSLISGIMMAVAGALGGYFVGKKKTQDKEAQAMKDGVKGLLRKATLELGLHYLKEGAVPPYGMETLRSCFDPYIVLGDGDPSVAHIVHKCENLPVRSGSEDQGGTHHENQPDRPRK